MKELIDSHIHTIYHHGSGDVRQMVKSALEKGVTNLGFAEHFYLPFLKTDDSSSQERFNKYIAEVEKVKAEKNNLTIRLGAEVDFVDGYEKEIAKEIEKYKLEFVIGSVHYFRPEGKYVEYIKDKEFVLNNYLPETKKLIKTGLYDVLAHMFLIKYEFKAIEKDFSEELKSIAKLLKERGMGLEINTSHVFSKELKEVEKELNPGLLMIEMCVERGVPIVLGSDAHRPEAIANHFAEVLLILKKIGIKKLAYFKDRKPIYYNI